jgi:hypothetical protein
LGEVRQELRDRAGAEEEVDRFGAAGHDSVDEPSVVVGVSP